MTFNFFYLNTNKIVILRRTSTDLFIFQSIHVIHVINGTKFMSHPENLFLTSKSSE